MKFWKKQDTCPRCGKALASSGKITGRTPVISEQTKERLCTDCAIREIGDLLPEEQGPAVKNFLDDTIKSICVRADLDEALITARCKVVVASDVEIQRSARGYDITFYALLIQNPEQTRKVVDYVVRWIDKNPLSIKPLTEKILGNTTLTQNNAVVFLFIPGSRPLPSSEDLDFMTKQILPDLPRDDVGWLVYSQPHDSGPENNDFIADALTRWQSTQSSPENIRLLPKKANTRGGRELVCLVVRYGSQPK
ncbi:MAG TPA: hypothetical protein PLT48_16295 [Nitrospira sp.]|nr:hypothetical protein [Nitrospira sp.]HMZ56415.1 hypothetical protein [Nitrospira sp.]HNA87450.1 hypothetical protein [Nitrospira sp.]